MKKILTALIVATVITMPLTVSDTANAQWSGVLAIAG